MCELLAISSQLPANMGFSLEKLASHSAYNKATNISNHDGWGVAYYEDKDATILREPSAANKSKLVQFIEKNIPPTQQFISHIRQATHGKITLRNTHPFSRELGGCMHIFAHNGHSESIQQQPNFKTKQFSTIGETDSEHAFCHLLEMLFPIWKDTNNSPPSLLQRYDIISEFSEKLIKLGPANFLYADSDFIFAHADKRTQEDGEIKPPGLYMLSRKCNKETNVSLEKHGVSMSQQAKTSEATEQQVTIIASVPLTKEAWQPLKQGELIVLSKGKQIKI